ncbi:hypothetical protein EQU24_02345 [Methylotuvimicrobium buryatense]|uniref:Uncharacterized protein n=1 Tax=Methylotuvimicrobium buryatense TaxID=95641 RepID=A0A4P9UL41_METBY|nr:hypothetical protein EQU24_02345 [Methylotuvimicrobium buryatense]
MLGEDVGKPPWMGLRRSSTGIPHTLKSAKLLKLGIAAVYLQSCRALALTVKKDIKRLFTA